MVAHSPSGRLAAVSTAAPATCLCRRGLRTSFPQNVHPIDLQTGPVVGKARTLGAIRAREDGDGGLS
ncbi:hypothetical protein HRbin40_00659 [bacterium HR40]|nr:hypothetical protein HRbin40_00659 [bacterium HR40]